MDPLDEHPSTAKPAWRRPAVRLAVGAGVAAALAIAGVVFAYAQTSTTTPPSSGSSTSTTAPTQKPEGPHHGGFYGPGIIGIGIGGKGAIHGEFVIPSGSGYATVDTQMGTVSAVSTDSITVKSADGFEKKYAVTTDTLVDAGRDGISSVKQGDTVEVVAKVENGTATAAQVNDATNIKASRGKFFPRPAEPTSPSTTTG